MALAESLTPRAPRVLVYDIETSPHLVWTYNLHDVSIRPDQIVTPSRLLCWAGKWTDSQQVMYYSEHHNSRREMVEALWHALNDADVVVGYNHRGFDNKHAMREFVTAGLGPPSPWVDVDLLKENRRLFKFASNRLGYVTETLGLPTKLDTGTGLWRKVLDGDEKAWAKFKAYNVADVRATQALLEYLAPYVRNVHLGLFTGDPTCCPTCGGTDLTPMGKTYTRTAAYPQLMCGCGAWCKVLANGQTRPI